MSSYGQYFLTVGKYELEAFKRRAERIPTVPG